MENQKNLESLLNSNFKKNEFIDFKARYFFSKQVLIYEIIDEQEISYYILEYKKENYLISQNLSNKLKNILKKPLYMIEPKTWFGLDGLTYELKIKRGTHSIFLEWHGSGGEAWENLDVIEKILEEILEECTGENFST